MSKALRILVTGSREWTDTAAVRRALADALGTYSTIGPPVLVHGGAVGADELAHREWANLERSRPGWLARPEVHEARFYASPRARNQHMVDLGATVCLAFALGWASGTGMCARMARRAGIPTFDHGVSTADRVHRARVEIHGHGAPVRAFDRAGEQTFPAPEESP